MFHGRLKARRSHDILDSNTLFASGGAVVASVLLGEPITTIATATSALTFEIGKATLKIQREKLKVENFKSSHNLRYLIDIKENL